MLEGIRSIDGSAASVFRVPQAGRETAISRPRPVTIWDANTDIALGLRVPATLPESLPISAATNLAEPIRPMAPIVELTPGNETFVNVTAPVVPFSPIWAVTPNPAAEAAVSSFIPGR